MVSFGSSQIATLKVILNGQPKGTYYLDLPPNEIDPPLAEPPPNSVGAEKSDVTLSPFEFVCP